MVNLGYMKMIKITKKFDNTEKFTIFVLYLLKQKKLIKNMNISFNIREREEREPNLELAGIDMS